MPVVWEIATGKKVYLCRSIDAKFAVSTGRYTYTEPVGGEDAYIAERASDTMLSIIDSEERARLGGPLTTDDRDRLGQQWVEAGIKPLPVE